MKRQQTEEHLKLLLTVEEAAGRCGLSRASMYVLLSQDPSLPVVRFGRAVRIPVAGLEVWLAARTQTWQPYDSRG
ncbi:MAG TPA: helix-turn-helix domain-containing protein [Chloroflexia bacterium]|nr:helix-turn-helix domain-containing protein [Chloroflexia bacterium]